MADEILNNIISEKESEIRVLVTPNPLDELMYQNVGTGEEPCIKFNSDVFLLFNSDRIQETLGEDVYMKLIKQATPHKTPYAENNFTDDQLFQDIKSRYIQSPAEMRAYMQQLIDSGESLIQEYNDELARQEAEKSASQSEETSAE